MPNPPASYISSIIPTAGGRHCHCRCDAYSGYECSLHRPDYIGLNERRRDHFEHYPNFDFDLYFPVRDDTTEDESQNAGIKEPGTVETESNVPSGLFERVTVSNSPTNNINESETVKQETNVTKEGTIINNHYHYYYSSPPPHSPQSLKFNEISSISGAKISKSSPQQNTSESQSTQVQMSTPKQQVNASLYDKKLMDLKAMIRNMRRKYCRCNDKIPKQAPDTPNQDKKVKSNYPSSDYSRSYLESILEKPVHQLVDYPTPGRIIFNNSIKESFRKVAY